MGLYGFLDGRRGLIALDHLGTPVLLVDQYTVLELDTIAKDAVKDPAEQLHIVLFEVLVHVVTGYSDVNHTLGLAKGYEHDAAEPCSKLLRGHVLANERKHTFPTCIRNHFH